MVKIGTCALGNYPRIAGVIDRIIPIEKLLTLKTEGVDLFEIRVDLIEKPFEEIVQYCSAIKNTVQLPIIGTIRENEWTVNNRIEMFKEIVSSVDAIDIELGTHESQEIVSYAGNATIIVSEHDYETTPSDSVLKNMIDRACKQGAHIVKLAVMANSKEDVLRLLRLTQNTNVPMVSISMGPIGTVSRVIAHLFGSLFTFGFIGGSVAPGQLSIRKLIEEIRLYYPK